MNRLLQHFVDSGTAQPPPVSRPSIPVPPQSSGGSYHAENRGSFHRAASGGPFYYQPPPTPNKLEEIPLTSQSSGVMYETVDLNADSTYPQWVHQTLNNREESGQKTLSSAVELFDSGPPPIQELPSSNLYERQSSNPFASSTENVAMLMNTSPRMNDLPAENGGAMSKHDSPKSPLSASCSQNNTHKLDKRLPIDAIEACQTRSSPRDQQVVQPVDPFASSCTHSSNTPFDTPSKNDYQSSDCLFTSSGSLNKANRALSEPLQYQPTFVQAHELFANEIPSASSLFGGDMSSPSQSPFSTLPAATTLQSSTIQDKASSSRSTPHGNNLSTLLPKPPLKVPCAPMRPPLASSPSHITTTFFSSTRLPVCLSSTLTRPENHATFALSSLKMDTPTTVSVKSELDARHMRFPHQKKGDDDTMSNAPSVAPSRMSMLSTLDDSIKLSDMYKHMATRLEGEKDDLLKIVSKQAREMAQMRLHIKSLELQLKNCRPQDA
ncbi:hypothetical protein CCR75_001986 [Bremia lactucae]|uniref:Uncharacterized protein n=1 Tax=Bremia lactucae TaxID=4779 RepID=A0A976ILZ5_BRELC|nr:hypothetical protein CCR75_001986 [Bremia lactucae]